MSEYELTEVEPLDLPELKALDISPAALPHITDYDRADPFRAFIVEQARQQDAHYLRAAEKMRAGVVGDREDDLYVPDDPDDQELHDQFEATPAHEYESS